MKKKVPRAINCRQRHGDDKPNSPSRAISRTESAFIDALVLGWPYWRAYQAASGSKCQKKSAVVQALRLLKRPAVAAELERRRATMDERQAMCRAEKRVTLAAIARDVEQPGAVRIAAIHTDNRMTGDAEAPRLIVDQHVIFTVNPFSRASPSLAHENNRAMEVDP